MENEVINETNETNNDNKKKNSLKSEALEWVKAILWAVVIAFVIRTFIFTVVRVDGSSMVPTLAHNQRLVVWRLGYTPKQGDIVIFHPACSPSDCYVKRVIATEGQHVEIDYATSSVFVDGQKLDEDYIKEDMRNIFSFTEATVPEDHIFVLGDNRNGSKDSRSPDVGFVSEKSVLGNAVLRFWPFNKICTF